MKDFDKLNVLLKDWVITGNDGITSIYHPFYDFHIDDISSISIDEINRKFHERKLHIDKINEIHKDLQGFITTCENGITSIRHFEFEVYDISKYDYDEINSLYLRKKELCDELKSKGDYINYIKSVPSYSRIYCFDKYLTSYNNEKVIKNLPGKLSGRKYWEFLRFIWSSNSYELFSDRHLWWKLLKSKNPDRKYFMLDEEREYFNSLPNHVKVYRGYVGRIYTVEINSNNKFSRCLGPDETIQGIGYSYTLSKEIGMNYFHKYQKYSNENRQNMLFEGLVEKDNILGFINDKMESEVVIIPQFSSNYGNPY